MAGTEQIYDVKWPGQNKIYDLKGPTDPPPFVAKHLQYKLLIRIHYVKQLDFFAPKKTLHITRYSSKEHPR